MDNDAIERALAAYPRPWTINRLVDRVDVMDVNGQEVDVWNTDCAGEVELITAAVNAYDPQRETQVAALVEALREARSHIVAIRAMDRAGRTGESYEQALRITTSPDSRIYLVERMDNALAPFTPQEANDE